MRTVKDGKQELLQGHTNDVSCLSVSRSGSHIASGQVDCPGFKVKHIHEATKLSTKFPLKSFRGSVINNS